MQEVQVKEVARREKGRVFFRFDNGTEFTLYRSEIRGLPQAESMLLMTEDAYLPVSLYEKILTEIVGKRAKKRALFLLERMDRTESQLCEKLRNLCPLIRHKLLRECLLNLLPPYPLFHEVHL